MFRSSVVVSLVVVCEAFAAPVPHAPVPKGTSTRTAPTDVEMEMPQDKDLPTGVERRFFLNDRPHAILCSADDFRVVTDKRVRSKDGKRIPGVPVGASPWRHFEMWELWPSGQIDPRQKLIEKHSPMNQFSFNKDRSQAVFGDAKGLHTLDFKTGKVGDIASVSESTIATMSADGAYLAWQSTKLDVLGLPERKIQIHSTEAERSVSFDISEDVQVSDVSPDGQTLLLWKLDKDGVQRKLVGREGKEIVVLKEGDRLVSDKIIFTPDRKHVLLQTENQNDGERRLRTFSYPSFKETRSVPVDRDLTPPFHFSNDAQLLFASETQEHGGRSVAIDIASGSILPLPEAIDQGELIPCDGDGHRFARMAPMAGHTGFVVDVLRIDDVVHGPADYHGNASGIYARWAAATDPFLAMKGLRHLRAGNVSVEEIRKLQKADKEINQTLTPADRALIADAEKQLGGNDWLKAFTRFRNLVEDAPFEVSEQVRKDLKPLLTSKNELVVKNVETLLAMPHFAYSPAPVATREARLSLYGAQKAR